MKINLFNSQLAWLFIICTMGTLSSCGGGGGGSNTSANTEVINGISVPPEPDPVQNNATVAGVDANNNGVRDDVERKIAETSPSNYQASLDDAKNYQLFVDQNPSVNYSMVMKKMRCSTVDTSDFVLNTENRKESYTKKLREEGLLLTITTNADCE